MAHAKVKSNKQLIKEGMETYKSKSAMKKHEKKEPKSKEKKEEGKRKWKMLKKVKVLKAKVKSANWIIILAIIADVTLIINAIHHW